MVPEVDAMYPLVFSPFIGSFLGVLVTRLPTGEAVVVSRSRCPHCGVTLRARDLVPVLSWLIARGKCRCCGSRIGVFYPAIELAALGVALWAVAVVPSWLIWPTCILGWTLLALAFIDGRQFLLPDCLTLPLAAAGLACAWWVAPDELWSHVLGAGIGFLSLLAVALAYRRVRGRDGLGMGDAKLLAASGAWVSLTGLPGVVLAAAVTALLWAVVMQWRNGRLSGSTAIPFGPFLALGTWLVWLYGPLVLTVPSL